MLYMYFNGIDLSINISSANKKLGSINLAKAANSYAKNNPKKSSEKLGEDSLDISPEALAMAQDNATDVAYSEVIEVAAEDIISE
ncbi:MAG: hypothetical protein MK033_10455 [Candidatus Caenarcaniphilales bacterium]|nr:hypothetical protein [Candidatus Caenarcaniphilales bacterium]